MKDWLTRKPRDRMPDLGARELSVLEVLWERDSATAQDVLAALPGGIALSTVQSTLERLSRKRLTARYKEGRAYRYRVTLSREQLIGGLLRDLANDLAGGRLAPMVSGFVQYVANETPAARSELKRALEGPDADEE